MRTNTHLKRIGLLIKEDIYTRRHSIIISAITLGCFLLLINLIWPKNRLTINESPTLYYWILYIGGFFTSALAFKKYHTPRQNYFYLMLPANPSEKFLSNLLITSIGYALFTLICYTLFYDLIALLSKATHAASVFFNPLSGNLWGNILTYITLQSIILLGSAFFKKHVLIKTALSLSIIALILFIFISLIGWGALNTYIFNDLLTFPDLTTLQTVKAQTLLESIKALLWIAFIIIMWITTYIRLKEIEV